MPLPHARPVLLLLPLLAAPLAAQQPRPDGHWELVVPPPESLPPMPALLIPALGAQGASTGGPPGGMGGEGERGGREPGRGWGAGRARGRDVSERDLLRQRQTLRLAFAAPVRVTIDRHGKALVLVDSSGVEQRWPIGATIETTAADSDGATGRVRTHVHWADDQLVVEHRVDGGGRVRESYGTGLDGSRMVVFVSVTTFGPPMEFRRQYRRME